jgi:ATP-dependent helicase/nuclease subunit A
MPRPTAAQRQAALPDRSVWVTANAGTGKTRVLADRFLRLLLAGAHPESVLAITFTKAAAAEMIERIERRLAGWATSDPQALATEIEGLTGEPASAELLAKARRLFAEILELPRGLSIMTIHAFCASLLRRFPLEAGVAPHFETLDERSAAELMVDAREVVLAKAASGDADLKSALETLAAALADSSLTEALVEILAQRIRIQDAIAAAGGLERLVETLWRTLDLEPGMTVESVTDKACRPEETDTAALVAAANRLIESEGKRDQECGRAILTWLNGAHADRIIGFEAYRRAFLVSKPQAGKLGELDPRARKNLVSKACMQRHPELERLLLREQARMLRTEDARQGVHTACLTQALLVLGSAIISAFEERKAKAAALDYDDLIARTGALLEAPGRSAWVLFKLDQRIDHLLVDEAQDTSPEQWAIIERIVDEFFAGSGARPMERTLFVVGDEKQSIYSFQGADLTNFHAMRERLRRRAGDRLDFVTIDTSFRSVAAVLEVVDRVFSLDAARAGVVEPQTEIRHEPWRRNEAGMVELWPLAEPPETEEMLTPWPLPDEPRAADNARQRLASGVARKIARWISEGERLESTGRPVRPGDILVLLSRRGELQELIIRALRRLDVPAAGADRFALREHIAVQDLIALGRAMLLPEDDLNLACLLKSPLVGLDEEALLALAFERGKSSIFERLRTFAGTDPARFGEAYDRVQGWLRRADFLPPFEFYTSILGEGGGRRRLVKRLGTEALEPIEAFLGQALAFEAGHAASLENFLHWLSLGRSELRRDPEQQADVVRVMTVHGAKGLEAPIVILADAGPQGGSPRSKLVWDAERDLPFWRGRQGERHALVDSACDMEEREDREERRRLLYVALTRARDRLYVTGARQKNESGERLCWHDLVREALASAPGVEPVDAELGKGFTQPALRLARGIPGHVPSEETPPASRFETPAWFHAPVAKEPQQRVARAASQLDSHGPIPGSRPGAAPTQRRIGVLVHRLLELVPGLPEVGREAAVRRWLERSAADLGAEIHEHIQQQVTQLLDHPELAPIFGPEARVEQAIAGEIGNDRVTGQIDRMWVGEQHVLVVDFKTGRPAPGRVEDTPQPYLHQMAAYRHLLAELFPSHELRCALVWTETATVSWLPAALLDAQGLAGVHALTLDSGQP